MENNNKCIVFHVRKTIIGGGHIKFEDVLDLGKYSTCNFSGFKSLTTYILNIKKMAFDLLQCLFCTSNMHQGLLPLYKLV